MYRGRLWTMRQYAGLDRRRNQRALPVFVEQGQSGLSVRLICHANWMDSDHALALGEVGKVGVAIDSLEDMERIVRGDSAGESFDVDDD